MCSGLGWGRTPRIKLKRPPKSLFLYDGSYSPPRRVWPGKDETLKEAWAFVEQLGG
jgi:hypothetical protein